MKYVYLVRAGNQEYKVGVATNVGKRIKGLQTSNPRRIECVTSKQTPNALQVEKTIHKLLREHSLDGGREWFKLDSDMALSICVMIQESPGISVSQVEQVRQLLTSMVEDQEDATARLANQQKALTDMITSLLTQADFQLKSERASLPGRVKVAKPVIDQEQLRQEQLTSDIDIARRIISKSGSASTSALQRHMRIGYGRAARLIDMLEQSGLISKADGNRPRQVL